MYNDSVRRALNTPERIETMTDETTTPEPEDSTASNSTRLLSVERSAVEALFYGSEGLQTLSHKMVALAHEKCPEHYKDFVELHKKHFNANCGPLHWHIRDLLSR
jgi:hypothetical protein